jgi:hypothetical protein
VVRLDLPTFGASNANKTFDGYQRLVGCDAVQCLAALVWVAGQVGDPVVLTAILSE